MRMQTNAHGMSIVEEVIDAISINPDGPVDGWGVDGILPLETTRTERFTRDDLSDKLLQLLRAELADKSSRCRRMSLGILILGALRTESRGRREFRRRRA